MPLGLFAALGAAVVFGVAAILQALGARRVPTASGLDVGMLLRLMRDPAFAGAVGLYLVGFLLHLVALRTLPLYLAQAGIAASLVVTAGLSVRMFGDRLRPGEWAAVGCVVLGLGMLTAAAGPPGDEGKAAVVTAGGAAFVWGLFAAVAVIAVAGLVATRSPGQWAAGTLGLLAGLGYAIDSIAVRLLPGLSPAVLWHAPATYVFLASAGLAFLLYSIGLQRGAVATSTAPMIVAQTAVPAVVGVLVLGDRVVPGLLPVAAAGLVLTTAGAARLGRFEGPATPAPSR